MSTHHETAAYEDSFRAFVSSSDEKACLFEAIVRIAVQEGHHSLLDIGVGAGELAIPLSSSMKRYIGIERNPTHVQRLRSQGLAVMQGKFPEATIGDTFDMVLASHSVPSDADECTLFLEAAWGRVKRGGSLVIVTYDEGAESEWGRFLALAGRHSPASPPRRRWGIEETLLRLAGGFQKRVVHTSVSAESPDAFIAALAFVYSDGREEACADFQSDSKVRTVLTRVYPQGGKYVFPFEHTLYVVRKG